MLVNVVVRVWRTWTKSIAGQPGWRNDRDRFVDEVSWGYDRDHRGDDRHRGGDHRGDDRRHGGDHRDGHRD
ncbi:hypothetical protein [Streptomyces sp. NPDC052721]|uniref:hypothetical protein n=1 Tax=Streptomyces sp. NPDC052721 TaxID=3154955 RepID=UPI0034467DFF